MYPKYEHYKDSDISWLGKIPESWNVTRFRYISHITTGTKNTEDKVKDGLYPFYVRSQTPEKINSYGFDGEAILTAGDGAGVGKVYHYVNGKFDFHQRVYKFSNFKKVIGKYLYYYLSNNFYNVAILGTAKSTVDSLRLPLIQNFEICYPILEQQTLIAQFLDQKTAQIDEAISIKERQIALLKEQKQIMIQNAVTKGLDPNVKMKDSGIDWIGEIPEHWEVKKLKYLTKINQRVLSETTSPTTIIHYVDIGSVSFERGIEHVEEFTFSNAPSRARRLAQPGDVAVSTVRTYLKAIAQITEKHKDHVFSTGFAILQPSIELVGDFLAYYTKSNSFTLQVSDRSRGISYPAINSSDLGEIMIVVPGKAEQKVLIQFIGEQEKIINHSNIVLENVIQKLKEYKTTLINSAVTGKIKVTPAMLEG